MWNGPLYPGVCLTAGGLTAGSLPGPLAKMHDLHWLKFPAFVCSSLGFSPYLEGGMVREKQLCFRHGVLLSLSPEQLPFPAHGLSSGSLSVLSVTKGRPPASQGSGEEGNEMGMRVMSPVQGLNFGSFTFVQKVYLKNWAM